MIYHHEYFELANKLNRELAQKAMDQAINDQFKNMGASAHYARWCVYRSYLVECQDGMRWFPGAMQAFANAVKDDLSFSEALVYFEELINPEPLSVDVPKADFEKTSFEEYVEMRSWELARDYTVATTAQSDVYVSFLKQCKAILREEKEPVHIRCELSDGSVKEWPLGDFKKLVGLKMAISESVAIILE